MFRGALVLLCAVGVCGSQFAFFRRLGHEGGGGARRVFGGAEAPAGAWPGACALLSRSLESRCSCAVVAPRWALTAAHCAQPEVAYVQYNGRDRTDSNVAPVKLLYSHPAFEAVVKDLGAGPDVVTLQHDVGLVLTRGDMLLSSFAYFPLPGMPRVRDAGIDSAAAAAAATDEIVAGLMRYKIDDLIDKEIKVLGFGMTEEKPAGERLREVRLRLTLCGREAWRHCACAMGAASGVCSGDSGGPVLYNGTQIGVMSMGPVECGAPSPLGVAAPVQAMSVFTSLRPYVSLINSTMHDVGSALKMRVVAQPLTGRAAPRRAPPRTGAGAALGAVSLLLCRSF